MNETQKEHARLLARAKQNLAESTMDLERARKGGKGDIDDILSCMALDYRVITFLEANAPESCQTK
jgi:hypothetical protein